MRYRNHNRHWNIMPRLRPVCRESQEIVIIACPEDHHGITAKTKPEPAGRPLQLSGKKLALVVNK